MKFIIQVKKKEKAKWSVDFTFLDRIRFAYGIVRNYKVVFNFEDIELVTPIEPIEQGGKKE